MTVLTREQILAAKSERQSETVEVPEWGGDVIVRELSGDESMESAGNDDDNLMEKSYRGLVRAIVNEAGERILLDDDIEVVKALGARSLKRLFDAVNRLNGVSAEGNAPKTPGGDSPSA
jgi:hypothetical protein